MFEGWRAGRRGLSRWAIAAVVGVLAIPLVLSLTSSAPSAPPRDDQLDAAASGAPASPLDDDALAEVAATVAAAMQGTTTTPRHPRLHERLGPVFVALRADGRRLGSGWGQAASTSAALQAATADAATDLGRTEQPDTAEVCFSHGYRRVDGQDAGELTNVHRGVLGIQIVLGDTWARYSPTHMLANNWDADDVVRLFAQAREIHPDRVGQGDVPISVFDCDQVLVSLGDSPSAVAMFRGNTVVEPQDVTPATVRRLAEQMGGWLTGAVHDDGRMTYKYWPTVARESDANNMIRQWMATVALNRWAAANDGDPDLYALAARNIEHNLERFYGQDGELGYIVHDGDAKLGAAGLAALAILEHPQRARFAEQEQALQRTIEHLWHDDGSFDTFLFPDSRQGQNQNFYPGEALLYWAARYVDRPDPQLLERFLRSFEHYRDWHLDEDNRNPAFVPWHTQAYYLIWQQTGDPRLRDFIFEMNDWLLSMQQWDDVPYPDLRGRFYDPARSHFGVPHASSTGVYLEGLIDAYRLAVEVGDDRRAERYAEVILRGLRSAMQLQFADEVDLYYVREPARARGGLRTTVYDNAIRVDNVQHTLMGVLKILEHLPAAAFDRFAQASG